MIRRSGGVSQETLPFYKRSVTYSKRFNKLVGFLALDGRNAEISVVYGRRAQEEYGLIYALAAHEGQIIYVELIFCNYFYDIHYEDMINEEYLPTGFDATKDSLYRQQRLGR